MRFLSSACVMQVASGQRSARAVKAKQFFDFSFKKTSFAGSLLDIKIIDQPCKLISPYLVRTIVDRPTFFQRSLLCNHWLGVSDSNIECLRISRRVDAPHLARNKMWVFNCPSHGGGAHSNPHLDFDELITDRFALKF